PPVWRVFSSHPYLSEESMRLLGLLCLPALGALWSSAPTPPTTIDARLTEWKVELSLTTVPAGAVTFNVSNGGSIPHAIEIEGRGVEKEIPVIQPGQTGTLTLTLSPGTYEVYC